MELTKLVNEYLNESKSDYKEKTFFHYKELAKIYLSKDVNDLSERGLNRFFLQNFGSGLSYSTIKVLKSIVNRSLMFGKEKKYIQGDAKVTTKFKQTSKPTVKSFTETELLVLENFILKNKKFYSYGVLISLYTGLRIGELLALKWKNVDFKNKVINVFETKNDITIDHKFKSYDDEPKTATSNRQIPISKMLLPILQELRFVFPESEHVVCGRKSDGVFIRAYQDSFSRLLKRLGIRHLGFHSLRHSFATRCFHNGMDVKTLSEILGHSSPSITLNIYVHTTFEQKLNSLDMVNERIKQLR
ncbi:MAG: site-specific integrase [Clostridia bacterium]|nr:site-specific integrase [Clostridia bacterium]